MKRLAFICVLATLFLGAAHARGFPSKEVRLINGFPAGGTSGIIGRLLPEVPVISKIGLKDFVIHNWFGLVGPGGMSPELQKRWNDELAKAVSSPELKRKFADNGLRIVVGTKEEFDKEIAPDRLKWGKAIRDFNIKPEN